MDDNTTDSWDKLTCIEYVDIGKCHDRFALFFCPKLILTFWMLTLKCSGETTTESFAWSTISMGEAVSYQFMQLKDHLVVVAE